MSKQPRKEIYKNAYELSEKFPEKPSVEAGLDKEVAYTQELLQALDEEIASCGDQKVQKISEEIKELLENEQIREPDISDCIILLAGFHAECARHVGLPASGSPCDENVAVFRNILTGCEAADQFPVKLPPGVVVYGRNTGPGLLKLRPPDQPFEAVVFPAGIFNIDQHTKAVFKGNLLHCRVIDLETEGIRHGGQTHFN